MLSHTLLPLPSCILIGEIHTFSNDNDNYRLIIFDNPNHS